METLIQVSEEVLKATALAPEITDRSSITPVYVYFDGNMLEECDTYDLIIRQSGYFWLLTVLCKETRLFGISLYEMVIFEKLRNNPKYLEKSAIFTLFQKAVGSSKKLTLLYKNEN